MDRKNQKQRGRDGNVQSGNGTTGVAGLTDQARAASVRFLVWAFGCLLVIGLQAGCVSMIPVDEYAIARAAMDGARDSEAPRFAPALWYRAEQAYREGEAFFRNRAYDEAQERFVMARNLAEQAENASRLARFESGDFAP
ncbi:MAG: hypothetical protein RBT63_04095 [Bdellovibrionales bacterium]|nr:hypothetical protein [Bdellovibrionales bacterium]